VESRDFLAPPAPEFVPGAISFLNVSRSLKVPGVDWVASDATKLWRYNLHYFDYLQWACFPDHLKRGLIIDWIQHCRPGQPDAWEAYPASLRIVNWIKYWLRGPSGRAAPADFELASLGQQLNWLERNLEHHLLANHLLKNAKALVFGAAYLEGPDAARWLSTGIQIMLDEAVEQLLPDGGHFERSPMYHCIVVEDYLDVLNLLRGFPGLVGADVEDALAVAAARGLRFLAAIMAGDGRIPLFNDSAFGIAAEPASLLGYGRYVLGDRGPEPSSGGRIELRESGYFGYRDGGESFIIDCGPIGPDYQPGHAHCDTLSFELCVDARRVVVDTGVFDYEGGPGRHQARSTAAHNTVRLDGAEQSEIWGAFRVARRARPLRAKLGDWDGDRLEFIGAHDGYRRLEGRMLHERRVVVERGRSWSVFDLITGSGTRDHRAESRVHLGPDWVVDPLSPCTDESARFSLRWRDSAETRFVLAVTRGSTVRLEPSYTFPEFGLRQANQALVIERRGALPLEMHYRIERV